MAKYLAIKNDNGNLVIDDESSIIQTLALSKTITSGVFNASSINSTDGYKPPSPYWYGTGVGVMTDIYGHKDPLKVDNPTNTMMAFRVIGDLSNPPYGYIGWSKWSDASPLVALTCYTLANTEFKAQVAWLGLEPYNKPLKNTAFVAYDELGNITFDAALGYVHHIATRFVKINVAGQSSNFTVQVMDLSGLGLDVTKLFLCIRSLPRVAQWEGSGNFYRVGYRSFIPRLRVTNNILYVDFGIWMPYPYTGSIAAIYSPAYHFSIYYIPSVKSY